MDYQNKPYSKWLDDMIIKLFDMDPAHVELLRQELKNFGLTVQN